MPHRHAAPTRNLPAKPSLAQLRKQAKELLKSYQAREQTTVTEVECFEQDPDPARFALADAQRVLARTYGFSSWTRLKQHVDGVNSEAFIAAAKAGDVITVRKLAKARPKLLNPNVAEFRDSALHRAVLNRDPEMTSVLMQLGADARTGIWPHRDATSAYTIAKDRQYNEIVAVIEQEEERRRQELSPPGTTINSKSDAIQAAIREGRNDEAIRILESDLSLIGARNLDGTTPLHIAAWTHNPEMVAWLVDRQAPYDVQDTEGRTPLDYAAITAGWSANDQFFPFLENAQVEPARFRETVQMLRPKGAALTPWAAVAIGDKQAVMHMHREGRLKNDVHFYRGGLLAIAVRVNRSDMVSLLLDLGFDPNEPAAPTEDGGESWGFPLWFAALCGRHDFAEQLIARGADVNAIVYACGDPLGNAQETGDRKMQALLLNRGARTTVERVANSGDRETAKAILDGKIPAQSLNVDEPSPTDLAAQLLWSAALNGDSEIVRMCLPHIPWSRDDPSWHYVMLHCKSPDCLKLILRHGVDPDVADQTGFTTLHHIAALNISDPECLALATLLLSAGASLMRRDAMLLSTPLGWACRWGREKLVELYLEHGADPAESGAESWATPLAWATKRGHDDIAASLRSHGAG